MRAAIRDCATSMRIRIANGEIDADDPPDWISKLICLDDDLKELER